MKASIQNEQGFDVYCLRLKSNFGCAPPPLDETRQGIALCPSREAKPMDPAASDGHRIRGSGHKFSALH